MHTICRYKNLDEDKEEEWNDSQDVTFWRQMKIIRKCNRVGLSINDIDNDLSKFGAAYNAREFEKIYIEEKSNHSKNLTSSPIGRSVKRYLRKPILLGIFSYALGAIFNFFVKVISYSVTCITSDVSSLIKLCYILFYFVLTIFFA